MNDVQLGPRIEHSDGRRKLDWNLVSDMSDKKIIFYQIVPQCKCLSTAI